MLHVDMLLIEIEIEKRMTDLTANPTLLTFPRPHLEGEVR